jgi:hypothetical protein
MDMVAGESGKRPSMPQAMPDLPPAVICANLNKDCVKDSRGIEDQENRW